MHVLLVNGSPHPHGCTFTALETVAAALNDAGVTTEIFQVGTEPLSGCIACRKCAKLGRCVFDDRVNEFVDLAEKADGFVFGSPVHYAAAGGAMTCFMDRAFYSSSGAGRPVFRLKPAAAVASARRAGTTATLDQLNKYMTLAEMPIVSSRYWNVVRQHARRGAPDLENAADRRPGLCRQQRRLASPGHRRGTSRALVGVRACEAEQKGVFNFIR